jgi:hypothetical protein
MIPLRNLYSKGGLKENLYCKEIIYSSLLFEGGSSGNPAAGFPEK